jgi:hypothetical protein
LVVLAEPWRRSTSRRRSWTSSVSDWADGAVARAAVAGSATMRSSSPARRPAERRRLRDLVDRDLHQPGPERRAGAEAVEREPGLDARLLRGVLRLGGAAGDEMGGAEGGRWRSSRRPYASLSPAAAAAIRRRSSRATSLVALLVTREGRSGIAAELATGTPSARRRSRTAPTHVGVRMPRHSCGTPVGPGRFPDGFERSPLLLSA